jgi:predicted phosphodiesterase
MIDGEARSVMNVAKLAALYDVHGNLPALEAALNDAHVAGCDEYVFGGDVASGYMPSETLSLLMSLQTHARFVMGNGDRELVRLWDGGEPATRFWGELEAWAARRLNKQQRDFLASFEPVVKHEIAGIGSVLFCHGTPRSDEEIVTEATPDEVFAKVLVGEADCIVGGHTHMQFERRVGGKRFINAGSIGMPYGGTGAYWLLVQPGSLELRRSKYDLATAAAILRTTQGPGVEEFVQENLLAAPTRSEAVEEFERQAGRGR